MGDLVAVRQELGPVMHTIEPILEQLLPPGLPPERLLQTLYVSIANNPTLARANRPSLLQAATSAAVLGLEVDGVSGQGYLVPFKGQAQFVTGYKGMVSLAARTGRTLEGFVVLEGDDFEFDEVSGEVRPGRKLGNEHERRLIAAYAISRGAGLPQMARVMSLDQLLVVRNASAGWRAKGERSTWGTNFEAMCRKTPMRRLSNDLSVLSLHQANALETMHDLGHHAWLHQDGGIIVDGHERDPVEVVREAREASEVRAEQPSAGELLEGEFETSDWVIDFGERSTDARGPERYEALLTRALEKADATRRGNVIALNRKHVESLIGGEHEDVANRLLAVFDSYS